MSDIALLLLWPGFSIGDAVRPARANARQTFIADLRGIAPAFDRSAVLAALKSGAALQNPTGLFAR